jgi:hypothetical protein
MNRHKAISISLLCVGITTCAAGIAQQVNWGHHPNLAAAQRFTEQAINKMSAAQGANEFDMNGHAAHAKDLLDQANREILASASAANHH